MKITVIISEIETGDGENFVELSLDQARTLWEQLDKVFAKPMQAMQFFPDTSLYPKRVAIEDDHGGMCACSKCVPAQL